MRVFEGYVRMLVVAFSVSHQPTLEVASYCATNPGIIGGSILKWICLRDSNQGAPLFWKTLCAGKKKDAGKMKDAGTK